MLFNIRATSCDVVLEQVRERRVLLVMKQLWSRLPGCTAQKKLALLSRCAATLSLLTIASRSSMTAMDVFAAAFVLVVLIPDG